MVPVLTAADIDGFLSFILQSSGRIPKRGFAVAKRGVALLPPRIS